MYLLLSLLAQLSFSSFYLFIYSLVLFTDSLFFSFIHQHNFFLNLFCLLFFLFPRYLNCFTYLFTHLLFSLRIGHVHSVIRSIFPVPSQARFLFSFTHPSAFIHRVISILHESFIHLHYHSSFHPLLIHAFIRS